MSEQRSLIVGFDLCNDYTQISCYNHKTFEPESIGMALDQTKYLIPTVLGVKNDTKDWVFGEEAVNGCEEGTVVLVDQLLSKVEKGVETEIFGTRFHPTIFLEKFFRKCLHLLKRYFPTNSILKIVITLKEKNTATVEAVYQALDNLGIGKDRAAVQSHSQSYQYYALSQSKELWMNDIGLFEFDESGLAYHQITINRKVHPYIVGMIEKDYRQTLGYDLVEDLKDSESLEFIFENIAKSVLYKQIISTIYVTGKGFEGSWADPVLKELCIGRRVFKGQNLYTKGACYAAKEMTGEHKFDDFIFFTQEMITSTFLIPGFYDAMSAEVVIAKGGTPWYEVDETLDLILDGEQSISFTIKDIITRMTNSYHIPLEGLPKRPNKTTRVEVGIRFRNPTTAIIVVKDKGFGEFFPSSNRIWEKEITLGTML